MEADAGGTPADNPTPTWIDRLPDQAIVVALSGVLLTTPACRAFVRHHAAGDARFAMWLRLVDYRLAQLGLQSDGRPTVSWRALFDDGLSPGQAVEQAREQLAGPEARFGPINRIQWARS
jgi:hypothetical protein